MNYAHHFIKITLVFHTPYLSNEDGDPQFLFHFWKWIIICQQQKFKKSNCFKHKLLTVDCHDGNKLTTNLILVIKSLLLLAVFILDTRYPSGRALANIW